MHLTKKLAAFGVALLGVSSLAVSAPMPASAAQPQPNKTVHTLNYVGNEALDINTELNCSSHTLTAKIKNKLATKLSPDVTFNGSKQELYPQPPIEPGKTEDYRFSYSGNNQQIQVQANVDTYAPLEVTPTLSCNEPVTFTVTSASTTGMTGMLTNNSSLVSQDVITRANNGDKRLEPLQPSESREVTLNYDSYPQSKSVYVSIGNTTGYQGNYLVDLSQPSVPELPQQPVPLPLPRPVKQD